MSETIVFFGSGPVAAKSLELLAQDFAIEAVITRPKPPHHRGSFPVIDLAEKLGLSVHLASNKKELSGVVQKSGFKSRVGVLIDFGIIVAQDVIDYFPLGIINSHFSILPEWRGADPITFAVLSGQKKTGVSLMLLVEAMDEGPLLSYGEHDLAPDITTPELTDYLIKLSHALLLHDLPRLLSGEAKVVSQDITGLGVSYSRKLSKNDGLIDWNKPAEQIDREIRAFIGWPRSRAKIAGKDIIITAAAAVKKNGVPGTITAKDKQLVIACGEDSLRIDKLQPAGKKEMASEAFLAGHKDLLT